MYTKKLSSPLFSYWWSCEKAFDGVLEQNRPAAAWASNVQIISLKNIKVQGVPRNMTV